MFYTNHARQRMAQRNLSEADVQFILQYGRRNHCAGVIQVHLYQKDMPQNSYQQRLSGSTVVLSRDETTVVTVWRNRVNGRQHIRRKLRYAW